MKAVAALLAVLQLAAVSVALAQPSYPPAVQDILTIRRLLAESDWRGLDSTFAERRRAALADVREEHRYLNAYGVFDADSTLEPVLDRWVRADSTPHYALLARASYYVARGWDARGDDWARNTPDERFAEMHQWMARGSNDLQAALLRDRDDVAANWIALQYLHASAYPERAREALYDGLRIMPGSLLLRASYLVDLTPRWGGSYEKMARFAEEQQRFAAANPELRALRGFVAYEEGRMLEIDDDRTGAIARYTAALAAGEYWVYRLARARAFAEAGDDVRALTDLNRVLAQRPANANALALRAIRYERLAYGQSHAVEADYKRRAARDFQLAAQLDPLDSDVRYYAQHYPELLTRPTGASAAAIGASATASPSPATAALCPLPSTASTAATAAPPLPSHPRGWTPTRRVGDERFSIEIPATADVRWEGDTTYGHRLVIQGLPGCERSCVVTVTMRGERELDAAVHDATHPAEARDGDEGDEPAKLLGMETLGDAKAAHLARDCAECTRRVLLTVARGQLAEIEYNVDLRAGRDARLVERLQAIARTFRWREGTAAPGAGHRAALDRPSPAWPARLASAGAAPVLPATGR